MHSRLLCLSVHGPRGLQRAALVRHRDDHGSGLFAVSHSRDGPCFFRHGVGIGARAGIRDCSELHNRACCAALRHGEVDLPAPASVCRDRGLTLIFAEIASAGRVVLIAAGCIAAGRISAGRVVLRAAGCISAACVVLGAAGCIAAGRISAGCVSSVRARRGIMGLALCRKGEGKACIRFQRIAAGFHLLLRGDLQFNRRRVILVAEDGMDCSVRAAVALTRIVVALDHQFAVGIVRDHDRERPGPAVIFVVVGMIFRFDLLNAVDILALQLKGDLPELRFFPFLTRSLIAAFGDRGSRLVRISAHEAQFELEQLFDICNAFARRSRIASYFLIGNRLVLRLVRGVGVGEGGHRLFGELLGLHVLIAHTRHCQNAVNVFHRNDRVPYRAVVIHLRGVPLFFHNLEEIGARTGQGQFVELGKRASGFFNFVAGDLHLADDILVVRRIGADLLCGGVALFVLRLQGYGLWSAQIAQREGKDGVFRVMKLVTFQDLLRLQLLFGRSRGVGVLERRRRRFRFNAVLQVDGICHQVSVLVIRDVHLHGPFRGIRCDPGDRIGLGCRRDVLFFQGIGVYTRLRIGEGLKRDGNRGSGSLQDRDLLGPALIIGDRGVVRPGGIIGSRQEASARHDIRRLQGEAELHVVDGFLSDDGLLRLRGSCHRYGGIGVDEGTVLRQIVRYIEFIADGAVVIFMQGDGDMDRIDLFGIGHASAVAAGLGDLIREGRGLVVNEVILIVFDLLRVKDEVLRYAVLAHGNRAVHDQDPGGRLRKPLDVGDVPHRDGVGLAFLHVAAVQGLEDLRGPLTGC